MTTYAIQSLALQLMNEVEEYEYLRRECQNSTLHPAVAFLADNHDLSQDEIRALAIEWPHYSITDPTRLAYTRSPQQGALDRQTICSLGSYLNKRFGHKAQGHEIEKLVAQYSGVGDTYETLQGDEIIDAMLDIRENGGPSSCMTNPLFNRKNHPYLAYANRPEWALFIRRNADSQIQARALVHLGKKIFVRVYGTNAQGTIRGDDAGLRGYLERNGITRGHDWAGCRLWTTELGKGYLAPYLDGGCTQGSLINYTEILIEHDGPLDLCQTGGIAVGHSGQIVDSDGNWIDEEDAVTLYNGDITHRDNAVYVESEDNYYYEHDTVYCHDIGRHELAENVFEYRGRYYLVENGTELYDGTMVPGHIEIVELENGDYALTDDPRLMFDEENETYSIREGASA